MDMPEHGPDTDLRSPQWAQEDGQTMVEYGLVLIAIALAALTAFGVFGGRVSDLVNTVNIT